MRIAPGGRQSMLGVLIMVTSKSLVRTFLVGYLQRTDLSSGVDAMATTHALRTALGRRTTTGHNTARADESARTASG
jgi:hypothetical protein